MRQGFDSRMMVTIVARAFDTVCVTVDQTLNVVSHCSKLLVGQLQTYGAMQFRLSVSEIS